MKNFKGTCAAAAILSLFALPGQLAAQNGASVEVIHALAGDAAAPALKLLIEEFESRCGCTWKDNAIAGGSNARQTMTNRAIGGDPGAVNQLHSPLVFKELIDAGLFVPVAPEGWQDLEGKVPEILWQNMTAKDGSGLVWTPSLMGLHNVGFFNAGALEKVGMETPQTLEELFAFLDAVKTKTDIVPIAWAEVPIIQFQSFHNLLAASAGPELYNRVFVDHDPAAFDTPEFREVAETYRRFKQYTDEGRVGRVQQDAANMVVQGQAAMQYLGTHILSIYVSNGMVAGKDYTCSSIGGTAILGPNGWVYGKTDDKGVMAGQQAFASMAMDPEFQVSFAELAGGLPTRVDADTSTLNSCVTSAAAPVAEGRTVADPSLTLGQIIQGPMVDAIVAYWADDSISVDDFIENLKIAIQN